MAKKFDLTTRANTLPAMSKVLATKWPRGLPDYVKIRAAGGTTVLLRANTSGDLVDARWGGEKGTWSDSWDLPTWTAELKCGYKMARSGASRQAIKNSCTRKR